MKRQRYAGLLGVLIIGAMTISSSGFFNSPKKEESQKNVFAYPGNFKGEIEGNKIYLRKNIDEAHELGLEIIDQKRKRRVASSFYDYPPYGNVDIIHEEIYWLPLENKKDSKAHLIKRGEISRVDEGVTDEDQTRYNNLLNKISTLKQK